MALCSLHSLVRRLWCDCRWFGRNVVCPIPNICAAISWTLFDSHMGHIRMKLNDLGCTHELLNEQHQQLRWRMQMRFLCSLFGFRKNESKMRWNQYSSEIELNREHNGCSMIQRESIAYLHCLDRQCKWRRWSEKDTKKKNAINWNKQDEMTKQNDKQKINYFNCLSLLLRTIQMTYQILIVSYIHSYLHFSALRLTFVLFNETECRNVWNDQEKNVLHWNKNTATTTNKTRFSIFA